MDFYTLDEFFEAEEQAREAADAEVSAFQRSLTPGMFCLRAGHFPIYSEILDPVQFMDSEDLEEIEEVRDSYNQPHMQHYRFTRSYSAACVRGELGDMHVSTAVKILTREEFEAARARGWV